jgi:cytochrome c-type biogenesis protein CcmE
VKPRTKFIIGGILVIGTASYLAASAIRDTGVYYLTPGELSAKTKADPTFYNTGVKVGARVVNGSIVRDPGGREVAFRMTDGAQTYSVVYRGITPDTFTDGVDVVVEGRLGRDNTFRATTLLAKCASRYENAPDKYKDTPDMGGAKAVSPRCQAMRCQAGRHHSREAYAEIVGPRDT